MCVIQHYTRWNCGCLIAENDQALVKICIVKARNAEALCTLYIVPAYDENMPAPDRCMTRKESDSSSDSGDSDETYCGEEEVAKGKVDDSDDDETENENVDSENSEWEWESDGGCEAVGTPARQDDDDDDDDDNDDSQNDNNNNDIVPEPLRIAPRRSITKKTSQETLVASDSSSTSGSSDASSVGDGDDDHDGNDNDGNRCKNRNRNRNRKRKRPIRFITSPRMCPEHEAKFENITHAYWRSETLWLQPKLERRGRRACQDLALAQRCADRLWELYLVWKFYNGGDPHGAVIATAADFVPLCRYSSGHGGDSGSKLKGLAEVDACDTLRNAAYFDNVTYRVLQWGLDNLLKVLRDTLHPREMVA